MATRRPPRNLPSRRANPLRELVAEKRRQADLARQRRSDEQLSVDLPSLVQEQVGSHMEKLEAKLVKDFQELGQRAIEESTNVLSEQLGERIQSLEQISAIQSRNIESLRDASRIAEEKVSAVVSGIERTLAGVVPGGFQLEAPKTPILMPAASTSASMVPALGSPIAALPAPTEGIGLPGSYTHPRLLHEETQESEARRDMVRSEKKEMEQLAARYGYCPKCTSFNIRRAQRQGLFEEFLRLFFIAPFRCKSCRHKFYRF